MRCLVLRKQQVHLIPWDLATCRVCVISPNPSFFPLLRVLCDESPLWFPFSQLHLHQSNTLFLSKHLFCSLSKFIQLTFYVVHQQDLGKMSHTIYLSSCRSLRSSEMVIIYMEQGCHPAEHQWNEGVVVSLQFKTITMMNDFSRKAMVLIVR